MLSLIVWVCFFVCERKERERERERKRERERERERIVFPVGNDEQVQHPWEESGHRAKPDDGAGPLLLLRAPSQDLAGGSEAPLRVIEIESCTVRSCDSMIQVCSLSSLHTLRLKQCRLDIVLFDRPKKLHKECLNAVNMLLNMFNFREIFSGKYV